MKDKIQITICTGTACFVMGSSDLIMLEEELPQHLKDHVCIKGSACLNYCKSAPAGKAPFVIIDDYVMSQATVPKVLDYLEKRLKTLDK